MKQAEIVIVVEDITHEEAAELVCTIDNLLQKSYNNRYHWETNISRRWLRKLMPNIGLSTRESRTAMLPKPRKKAS
jgi:hypothetical protein